MEHVHGLLVGRLGGPAAVGLARLVNWVGWHWFEEGRLVGVVRHGHVEEAVSEKLSQGSHVLLGGDALAGLEASVDDTLEGGIASLGNNSIETILHSLVASIIRLSSDVEVVRGNLGESARNIDLVGILEQEDWGRGGEGTLDDVRILHPHPGGEHASVRSSERDSCFLLGIVLGFDVVE